MKTRPSGPWRCAAGGLSAIALSLVLLPATASASTTVVPISTFSVSTSACAGGAQSQIVQDLQDVLQAVPELSNLGLPIVSLNPGCKPAPAALSSIINASNTVTTSPSGSVTAVSRVRGNSLFTEQADVTVDMTATVPLTGPASSVTVTIPYRTSGVTLTPAVNPDGASYAADLVLLEPVRSTPIRCADGSQGSFSPNADYPIFNPGDVTAGSGTTPTVTFSCRDGSDLVSGLEFRVEVDTDVLSANGSTETASANLDLVGVTATINS